MARNFPFDTLRQRALMELYEKEATAQLENYLKSRKLSTAGQQSKLSEVLRNRAERNRIPTEGLKERLPPIKKKNSKASIDLRVGNAESGIEENTNEQPYFGMLPPNTKVRDSLYNGFSKEGKGRVHYLEQRRDLGPEQKYTYPVLSSWTYGWGMGDYAKRQDSHGHAQRHCRTKVIEETFYGRTGVPIKQFDGMLQRSFTIF